MSLTVDDTHTQGRTAAAIQRAIFNDAGCVIISTDTEGCITGFNPAAEMLFGWRAQEVIGKNSHEIFHLSEEIAARAKVLSARLGKPVMPGFEVLVADARSGTRSGAEWTCVRKDGRRIRVLVSITPLRGERGSVFGFLEVALEIAEHRESDTKLFKREADVAAERDVAAAYEYHASSFVTKPVDFQRLSQVISGLGFQSPPWNEKPVQAEGNS